MSASTTPAASMRGLYLLIGFVVVAAALAMGIRQSFGLFLQPMIDARGWSASGFAFAIALQVLLNGVSQPICGQLADRYGARIVAMGGALLYMAGLAGMALSESLTVFTFFAGVVMGVAVSAAGMPVLIASLTRQMPEAWRGRASGLGTAGSSLGQFLVVPLSGALIGSTGWQWALFGLMALSLLMLPLVMPLAGRPAPVQAGQDEQTAGEALRLALGSRSFWCLFAGFFVCGVHVSFLTVHLPGFVATCHLPGPVGSGALALVGLFNIAGSLIAGELSIKWKRREMLVAIYGLRALLMTVFMFLPKTTATVLIFAAIMGLLWLSTVPPTISLCARNFGTRWLATIFGLVFFGHQIGGFLGAWLGGVSFDLTGSYDAMWWFSIALGAFAAIINLPVRDQTPAARPAVA